jgi:LCP family protein required for cell wall assembly
LPGGGPDLASRTVEHVLGVPIHYYAQIDFSTFIYMVDYIGGIDVYVEKKITIDPIGPGADDVVLPVGVKHLDGMRALAYARARNSKGGDVDRARRTQQVILAIRDKALNPNTFPVLMSNAPRLYQLAQQGIKTNMALDDALKMAVLMQQIPPENIKQGVINYDMVLLDDIMVNGENQSIFKPIPDKIRELRDTIFTAGGALSPAAKGNDLADLMRQEGATVIVRNGTYTQGLAIETGDYLKTLGVNILGTDNANEVPGVTKIIDHRGRPYALRFFVELFKITGGNQVVIKYDPTAPADIEIILGDDWAFNNPMP